MFNHPQTSCDICHQTISNLSYLPKELSDLEILICESCFYSSFLETELLPVSFQSFSTYPGNQQPSTVGSLSELSKFHKEHCSEHKKEIDLFCTSDSCGICYDCALFGKHKGHTFVKIDNLIEEKSSKVKQLTFLMKIIDQCCLNFSNLYCKGREDVIKDIELSFNNCINKLLTKKLKLIEEVQQKYRKTQEKEIEQDPLIAWLMQWKNSMAEKLNLAKGDNEEQIAKSLDILSEDTKKIAFLIKQWSINKQKSESYKNMNHTKSNPKLDQFDNIFKSLDKLISQFTLNTNDDSKDNVISADHPLKAPRFSLNLEEREINSDLKNNSNKTSQIDLISNIFDIQVMQHCAEFKVLSKTPKTSSQKNLGLISFWLNSSINSVKFELPCSKLNNDTELCLNYLLAKENFKSLSFILKIDILHKDVASVLSSMLQSTAKLTNLEHISFHIIEENSILPSARESLFSAIFFTLKELKGIQKLDLNINMNSIDDVAFLEIIRKISEYIQLKEISISIKPGSKITDNSLRCTPMIWVKMSRLQKLNLCLPSCHMITNFGVESFLQSIIQLKSLKEIYLDIKNSSMKKESLHFPTNCKNSLEDANIIVKRPW